MEPMALGSAPSSPASPTTNPNFLPAFLMGDATQPNTSPGRNHTTPNNTIRRKLAPNTNQKHFNNQSSLMDGGGSSTPMNASQHHHHQSFTSQKSGPPKQGLFDTIDPKRKAMNVEVLNSTAITYTDSPGFSKNFSRINDDSLNCSNASTRNNNMFTNLNETVNRIDTNWVTVFGFPPSACSLILAKLASCGTIMEKRMAPSSGDGTGTGVGGNWMHVKFSTFSEVSRALALNGRCINNCLMIGVTLYYDKATRDSNKENDGNIYATPVRARSLRHSFISPNAGTASNSVLPPQNVPQKSTGLVSKAIEYVFGW